MSLILSDWDGQSVFTTLVTLPFNLFSPSPLRSSGRKSHFCLPQAKVNSVVPRQNGRECYIFSKIAKTEQTNTKMLNIIQKVEKMHFLFHMFFQNCCQLVEKLFDMLFTQSRCARNQGLGMFWCFSTFWIMLSIFVYLCSVLAILETIWY